MVQVFLLFIIQKQNTVMGQADFSRLGKSTASHQCNIRDGMMRLRKGHCAIREVSFSILPTTEGILVVFITSQRVTGSSIVGIRLASKVFLVLGLYQLLIICSPMLFKPYKSCIIELESS